VGNRRCESRRNLKKKKEKSEDDDEEEKVERRVICGKQIIVRAANHSAR